MADCLRSNNYFHTFLDSVKIYGLRESTPQVYKLEYLNRSEQTYNSFIPDYWGYYKTTSSAAANVFPMFDYYGISGLTGATVSDLNSVGLTRTNRNPRPEPEAATFSLRKIIYPTGGFTEYEYEPHKYLGLRDDNNTLDYKYAGMRIQKITSNDVLKGATLIKEYRYGINENGVGQIATIDLANSKYFAQDSPVMGCVDTGARVRLLHRITYNTVPNTELSESFFGSCPLYYSKITEYTRETINDPAFNNGKIEYYFDNPAENLWSALNTNPNFSAWTGFSSNLINYGIQFANWQVYYPNYYIYQYRGWDKPVLGSKMIYKSSGSSHQLVSKQINKYNTSSQPSFTGLKVRRSFTANESYTSVAQYYAGGINSLFDYAPYSITFANKIRTESDIISYNGSDSLQVKEKYYYNSDYQLAKTETWNSDGSLYTKTTKYPIDYGDITATDNASLGLKRLQTSHVLNTSIEDVTEHGTSTKLLVDAVFKTFKTDKPLVDKVFSAESDVPVTNFTHSFNNSGAFNSDTRYQERARFNSYDGKGNLLEQQKTLGAKEVFLWGYDSNYPVAKVIGSDLATVQGFINQSILNNQTTTDLAMRTELNKIRVGLASSNVQVSTYTYQPLVGISSETDPIGKTLLYEYDRHGRLAAIKNSSGATRVSYCYNYAGQPEPCTAIAPTGSIAASNLILIASVGPALPVTLIGFNATKTEKTTLLNWTTTNEINSDRFEIERSSNAKKWNKIGTVLAAGDEKGNKQYSFTDMYSGAVPAGEYLYRLKMVDADGQHAYSSIQSVSFDKNGDLVLYPNPVTIGEKLTLQTDDFDKIREIRILDSYGKVVLKSSSTRLLDTSKLSPGLYLVQVTFLDNSISTQRIVKQ